MKSLKMDLRWLLTVCAIAAVCALICFVPQARATGGTVSGCAYVDANSSSRACPSVWSGVKAARGQRRIVPKPTCTANMILPVFRLVSTV